MHSTDSKSSAAGLGTFESALDERLVDDYLCGDIRQFASLPGFDLFSHRFLTINYRWKNSTPSLVLYAYYIGHTDGRCTARTPH